MKQIPLSKGMFAIVSAEDYDFVMQWKWCASEQGIFGCGLHYAVRFTSGAGGARREKIWLHKEIAIRHFGFIPEGHVPDHGKGGTLDCQRGNLTIIKAEDNKTKALRQGWLTRANAEPCL